MTDALWREASRASLRYTGAAQLFLGSLGEMNTKELKESIAVNHLDFLCNDFR